MKNYDVVIIGGGASGLACAVILAETPELKVLVIDSCDRLGKKLSATGNGQGNISNEDMDLIHYRSGSPEIVKSIIGNSQPSEKIFERIFGTLLYKHGSGGRIYPQSLQASSLTDILIERLRDRGVDILLSTRVTSVERGFTVNCGNEKFSARFVVLATGGKAQKQFGTDGSSYVLAENFGHKITPLYPSIVQLKTDTAYIKNLRGVRVDCLAKAISKDGVEKSARGDVIFTDYGVSGNAVFYVSSVLAKKGGQLDLVFLPDFDEEVLKKVLMERKREGVYDCDLLCGLLHNQIARAVLRRAENEYITLFHDDLISAIVHVVKHFTLNVVGTLGFDYAQVTQGGVDMSDISYSLESKLCENLYFSGEILDVDGDCGGYNLHWAFMGAVAVADSIKSKIYYNEKT